MSCIYSLHSDTSSNPFNYQIKRAHFHQTYALPTAIVRWRHDKTVHCMSRHAYHSTSLTNLHWHFHCVVYYVYMADKKPHFAAKNKNLQDAIKSVVFRRRFALHFRSCPGTSYTIRWPGMASERGNIYRYEVISTNALWWYSNGLCCILQPLSKVSVTAEDAIMLAMIRIYVDGAVGCFTSHRSKDDDRCSGIEQDQRHCLIDYSLASPIPQYNPFYRWPHVNRYVGWIDH